MLRVNEPLDPSQTPAVATKPVLSVQAAMSSLLQWVSLQLVLCQLAEHILLQET